MMCPGCGAHLAQLNSAGEPMIRSRGMVFKPGGLAMICPKCKCDVPVVGEMAKAMQDRIIIFFRKSQSKP